jgi:hypothetical protein
LILQNATTSLAIQKQLAKDASYMLQPGQYFPPEASASISLLGASATSDPVSHPTSTTSATPTPVSSHSGLSSGAIAGVAVCAAAVFVLAAALFFFIGRSRKAYSPEVRQSSQFTPTVHTPDIIQSGDVLYAPVGRAIEFMNNGIPPAKEPMKSPDTALPISYSSTGYNSFRSPVDRYVAVVNLSISKRRR